MSLNKEQINCFDRAELEDLAYNLVPIETMAVILEVDEMTLRNAIAEVGSDAWKAFHRGYGKQLVEQRKALIKAAKNGSNPAQEALAKITAQFTNDIPKP